MESFSLERVQINLASSSRPVLSRGHEGVVREKSTSVGEVAVKEYRVVDSLRRELNIIRHYFGKPSKRFGFFSLPLNAQSARARLEMEYARQLGDVIDVMNTCGPPSLAVRRVVAVSCLLACECLDSMKLCHTDIKLENILVCRDGSIKLCDMGSCVPYGGRVVVQSEMASPFQLNSSVATLDGMLWCVGCAVYELATGRIPYPYKAVVRGDMAAIDWDKISLKINTNLTEREKPLVRRLLLVPPGARGARGRSPFEDLWSLSWFWTMDLDAIRHGGVRSKDVLLWALSASAGARFRSRQGRAATASSTPCYGTGASARV